MDYNMGPQDMGKILYTNKCVTTLRKGNNKREWNEKVEQNKEKIEWMYKSEKQGARTENGRDTRR